MNNSIPIFKKVVNLIRKYFHGTIEMINMMFRYKNILMKEKNKIQKKLKNFSFKMSFN